MKAKTSKMLDKAEDPRETLDYSYEKQLELLTKVKRGVADVATSRKRIEIQMQQLQASRQGGNHSQKAELHAFHRRRDLYNSLLQAGSNLSFVDAMDLVDQSFTILKIGR